MRTTFDQEYVVGNLVKNSETAQEIGNIPASNQALMMLAKVLGIGPEKAKAHEITAGQVVFYIPENGRDVAGS